VPAVAQSTPAVRSLPWSITDSLSSPNNLLVLGSSGGIVSVNNPNFNATPVYYRIQAGVGSLSETGLVSSNFRGGSLNYSLSPADIPHLPNNTSVPLTLSFFQKDQSGREVNTVSKTYSYVVSRPLTASLNLNRPDRLYKEGDVLSFSVDAQNTSQPFSHIYWKLSGSGLSSSTFTSSSNGNTYGTSLSGAVRLVSSAGYNPSGVGKLDYPVSPMLFSRNSTVDGNRLFTLSIYSDSSYTKLLDSEAFTLSDSPAPVVSVKPLVTGGSATTPTSAPVVTATVPVSSISTVASAVPSAPTQATTLTSGRGLLTGTSGSDTFTLSRLSDSQASNQDLITEFDTTADRIDLPGTGWRYFDIGVQVFSPDVAQEQSLSRFLQPVVFKDSAAFKFNVWDTSKGSYRTYLAVNGSLPGYQESDDALIEITGANVAFGRIQLV